MRLLTHEQQNEVYKRLVNITVELMKRKEEPGAQDAIDYLFQIAYIVGGVKMLRTMERKNNEKY